MNKHCQNAKKSITMAESADAKMALYRDAAEEIEKAINEDHLTRREVAAQIGRSHTYVNRLLGALERSRSTKNGQFVIDWRSGPSRQVPVRSEGRADLATELMSDPRIVQAVLSSRTPAASNVRKAVAAENAAQRSRSVEEAERKRQATAMPINALYPKIAEKIGDWSNALMEIEEDLVEARDQLGASIVITALRMHAETCLRLADRMQLDVGDYIESR
jgi:hypothetical protein